MSISLKEHHEILQLKHKIESLNVIIDNLMQVESKQIKQLKAEIDQLIAQKPKRKLTRGVLRVISVYEYDRSISNKELAERSFYSITQTRVIKSRYLNGEYNLF